MSPKLSPVSEGVSCFQWGHRGKLRGQKVYYVPKAGPQDQGMYRSIARKTSSGDRRAITSGADEAPTVCVLRDDGIQAREGARCARLRVPAKLGSSGSADYRAGMLALQSDLAGRRDPIPKHHDDCGRAKRMRHSTIRDTCSSSTRTPRALRRGHGWWWAKK